MWKKDEPGAMPSPGEAVTRPETPRRTSTPSGERATIGRSITVRGDVTGDEDLLIQGRVDGSVELEKHAVTVGADGRVKANITGRVVEVEGEVEGDLTAQEQIVLRGSARVQGDIRAPRVILEDGATFRGLVDMGASKASSGRPAAASTETKTSPTTGATAPATTGASGESTSEPKEEKARAVGKAGG